MGGKKRGGGRPEETRRRKSGEKGPRGTIVKGKKDGLVLREDLGKGKEATVRSRKGGGNTEWMVVCTRRYAEGITRETRLVLGEGRKRGGGEEDSKDSLKRKDHDYGKVKTWRKGVYCGWGLEKETVLKQSAGVRAESREKTTRGEKEKEGRRGSVKHGKDGHESS